MSAAPEYRFHRPLGCWVLVAPGRAAVMSGHDTLAGLPELKGPCPFCPENIALSSNEIRRAPSEGAWSVRIVENKYPIVHGDDPSPGFAPSIPGAGKHELLIETPVHDGDLATYSDAHRTTVLGALRDRHAELASIPSIEWVAIFRNKGLKSGSSQPHPHMQLVGSSVGFADPATRWQRALAHHAERGENMLDSLVADELGDPSRIVYENGDWLVVAPFAPMRTFETWVVPKRARGCFSAMDDSLVASLSMALGVATRAMLGGSGRTDYNVVFRLPPTKARRHPAAYFLVELIPRGTSLAGFELASGSGVVAISPERSADQMRSAASASRV